MDVPLHKRGCLYCGDVERPRTAEHVLQEAFGTNLVLEDDVCGDCNTKVFSPLDTKLIEFVRQFGFSDRPDEGARRMFSGKLGVTFDPDAAIWTSVVLNSLAEPRVLPQFVFKDDQTSCVFTTDQQFHGKDQLQTISKELREPQTLTIETQLWPDKSPPMDSAVVRSAPRRYVVRAANADAAARLRRFVEEGKLGGTLSLASEPRTGRHFQPKVEMNLSIPLGSAQRAIAKIAMNFVCKVVGPDAARGEGLKGLREFARQGEPLAEANYVSIFFPREPDSRLAALFNAFRQRLSDC